MTAELWWAQRPSDHPSEYAAVRELAFALDKLQEHYFIFANFNVPKAQIDLAILTHSSIFLVELKHSTEQPIHGGLNGTWTRADGTEIGTYNPIQQVIAQYHNFRNWLKDHHRAWLSPNRAASLTRNDQGPFPDIKKFIALYPTKHPNSEIDVGNETRIKPPLGDIIGFDELTGRITDPAWQCTLGIEFSNEEIRELARNLGLIPIGIDSLDDETLQTRTSTEQGPTAATPPPTSKSSKRRNPLKWGLLGALGAAIVVAAWVFLSSESQADCGRSITEISKDNIRNRVTVNFVVDEIRVGAGNFIYISATSVDSSEFDIMIDPQEESPERIKRIKQRFADIWLNERVIVGPKELTEQSEDAGGDPRYYFGSPDEAQKSIQVAAHCR